MNSALAQRRKALKRANKVRSGWKDLKRQIYDGERTVGDALSAECAQRKWLWDLLEAQKGWGPVRTSKACNRLGFRDRSVRVDHLSDLERQRLLGVFPANTSCSQGRSRERAA